jgi:hypothetical protein
LLVNAKPKAAIWVRFLVLGRQDTFQEIDQIIDPVTGSHRFKHGAIGAGQLDQLHRMRFGAAGASNGGGSWGFHTCTVHPKLIPSSPEKAALFPVRHALE